MEHGKWRCVSSTHNQALVNKGGQVEGAGGREGARKGALPARAGSALSQACGGPNRPAPPTEPGLQSYALTVRGMELIGPIFRATNCKHLPTSQRGEILGPNGLPAKPRRWPGLTHRNAASVRGRRIMKQAAQGNLWWLPTAGSLLQRSDGTPKECRPKARIGSQHPSK